MKIEFQTPLLILVIFDSHIYCLLSDGRLDTCTMPLAILVGMYTDGIQLSCIPSITDRITDGAQPC